MYTLLMLLYDLMLNLKFNITYDSKGRCYDLWFIEVITTLNCWKNIYIVFLVFFFNFTNQVCYVSKKLWKLFAFDLS